MLQSQLFTKTKKQAPKDEKSTNAILLERAGFIYKEMAGVYTFLPLGLRVLKKIENIIREEMNKIGGQEVLMTALQPKNLWQKTDRWDKGIGKEIMYKCQDEEGKEIGLGPTHEEMLTDIIRNYVQSYEDLPLYVYQIQSKFRKELRAKAGLLRGREFEMKDLYSFHASDSDFKDYYERAKKAYFKIFERCGLETILTEASGAGFTQGITHEFQVLAKSGEDEIIYCPSFHFSQNKEIAKFKQGDKCPKCSKLLKREKSIEVGNIFPLGNIYSKAIGAFFQDKDGSKKTIIMGCYGIGVSRLMGTIVEVFNDKNGIIWPEEVAPFQFHLITVLSGDKNKDREIKKTAQKIYSYFNEKEIEILYDDREGKSAGEKFAEADLIGIPERMVISEKTLQKKSVETKQRKSGKIELVKINKLTSKGKLII